MKDDLKLRSLLSRNVNNIITEQLIEEIIQEYATDHISSQKHGPTESRIPAGSRIDSSATQGSIDEVSIYNRGQVKDVGASDNGTTTRINRNLIGDSQ